MLDIVKIFEIKCENIYLQILYPAFYFLGAKAQ